MKRTTTAATLIATLMLAGCTTQTDEAREYAETACTNYNNGSADMSVDYALVSRLVAERKLIDDEVTPGLASAAKRDEKYASAHAAASKLSATLLLLIPAVRDETAPNRQALGKQAIEGFATFDAECDVILAE